MGLIKVVVQVPVAYLMFHLVFSECCRKNLVLDNLSGLSPSSVSALCHSAKWLDCGNPQRINGLVLPQDQTVNRANRLL